MNPLKEELYAVAKHEAGEGEEVEAYNGFEK